MDSTAFYLLCSSSIANKTKALLQISDSLPKQLLGDNLFVNAIRNAVEPTGVLLDTLEMAVEQLLLLYSSQFEDFQVEMIADYFNALSFGFESDESDLIVVLKAEQVKNEKLLENAEATRTTIKNLKEKWIDVIKVENERLEENYNGCCRSVEKHEKQLQQLKKAYKMKAQKGSL